VSKIQGFINVVQLMHYGMEWIKKIMKLGEGSG